jgi:hypothetical protein
MQEAAGRARGEDVSLTPADIEAVTQWRAMQFAKLRDQWDILASIWRGGHQDLFPDEYPASEVPKVAGFIRRSAKMFGRLVGQVPDAYVSPLAETARALADQDKVEKIIAGYNDVWAMELKMGVLANFEVLFGAAAVGVIPDPRLKYPMMLVEDPRNALPGAGWSSTGVNNVGWPAYAQLVNFLPANDAGGQLEDCIIRKMMTAAQVKSFDPGSGVLNKILGDDPQQLNRNWTVLMFYDSTDCYMVLGGTGILLNQSPHGAPWCPWWFPTNFCFDSGAGDSDYYQQIGLEVAYSTLLSQKLALNDAVVFPWLAKKGIWEIDPETRSMQAASPDAAVQTLSPSPTFQVDRDLAMLQNDLRTLNMETEATQGQLPGGPITGQGIQQLNQAPVVETVQDYFKKNGWLLPRVYATALIQDREVFPNVTKDISSWVRGETFFTSYTPAKDIGTKLGRIVVDFGPGLGGYQGHIAQLQDLGADVMSKLSVMEKNRSIRSVRAERARMWQQKLDALVEASLTGQTAVPPEWISRAYIAVGEGQDFHEWSIANPPTQSTATPENTPPLSPGIAAAAQAAGQAGPGGPPGPPGPPGAPPGAPAGFLGPATPQNPGLPAGQGGVGPGPNVFHPPALNRLIGS